MEYSQEILNAALEGLQLKLARIEEQIAQVRAMTKGKKPGKPRKAVAAADDWETPSTAAAPARKAKKGKRQLSPEARERIAAAQRKRWAAHRGE
jgi:hypothetical protein